MWSFISASFQGDEDFNAYRRDVNSQQKSGIGVDTAWFDSFAFWNEYYVSYKHGVTFVNKKSYEWVWKRSPLICQKASAPKAIVIVWDVMNPTAIIQETRALQDQSLMRPYKTRPKIILSLRPEE